MTAPIPKITENDRADSENDRSDNLVPVAVSPPRIICINGSIVADGPPEHVTTTPALWQVYGAEMPAIEYHGIILGAASGRFWAGANAPSSGAIDQSGSGVDPRPANYRKHHLFRRLCRFVKHCDGFVKIGTFPFPTC